MNQKRVWLYCRVAHRGLDSAEVLKAQRHRLEDYAKKYDFEIVGSSCDIGSGLTLDRPGLLEFHAAAECGAVDVLLVHKLSRLGRDVDKVTKYWHLLCDLGVSVRSSAPGNRILPVSKGGGRRNIQPSPSEPGRKMP